MLNRALLLQKIEELTLLARELIVEPTDYKQRIYLALSFLVLYAYFFIKHLTKYLMPSKYVAMLPISQCLLALSTIILATNTNHNIAVVAVIVFCMTIVISSSISSLSHYVTKQ